MLTLVILHSANQICNTSTKCDNKTISIISLLSIRRWDACIRCMKAPDANKAMDAADARQQMHALTSKNALGLHENALFVNMAVWCRSNANLRFRVVGETSNFLETLGVPTLGALPCVPTHTLHTLPVSPHTLCNTSLCPHTHHGLQGLGDGWAGWGSPGGTPKSLSLTPR